MRILSTELSQLKRIAIININASEIKITNKNYLLNKKDMLFCLSHRGERVEKMNYLLHF